MKNPTLYAVSFQKIKDKTKDKDPSNDKSPKVRDPHETFIKEGTKHKVKKIAYMKTKQRKIAEQKKPRKNRKRNKIKRL